MTCKTDFESAIYVLERKEAHRNEGSNRYMVGGGGKKSFQRGSAEVYSGNAQREKMREGKVIHGKKRLLRAG